jgi:hypothetical protein
VAFGVEKGKIINSQMTSSSSWSTALATQKGRLNGVGSWSARRNDQNQWIQVDLGRKEVITAIATQGRSNYNQWVKTYSVSYSLDGNTFVSHEISGVVKVRFLAVEQFKGCGLQYKQAICFLFIIEIIILWQVCQYYMYAILLNRHLDTKN